MIVKYLPRMHFCLSPCVCAVLLTCVNTHAHITTLSSLNCIKYEPYFNGYASLNVIPPSIESSACSCNGKSPKNNKEMSYLFAHPSISIGKQKKTQISSVSTMESSNLSCCKSACHIYSFSTIVDIN